MDDRFKELCKIIIDKNGNLEKNDVLNAGYSVEHFNRLSCANPDRLVKRARENLLERGIHYKEECVC